MNYNRNDIVLFIAAAKVNKKHDTIFSKGAFKIKYIT
jgi:hypothetical protein